MRTGNIRAWVLRNRWKCENQFSNDSLEVHMLSERFLKVVGANNFMLFTGA